MDNLDAMLTAAAMNGNLDRSLLAILRAMATVLKDVTDRHYHVEELLSGIAQRKDDGKEKES